MYSRFAPMNGSTVRFAKDYRTEDMRTVDRSRRSSMFKQPLRQQRAVPARR